MLQRTMYEKQNIDLSAAPWTMHVFLPGVVWLHMA